MRLGWDFRFAWVRGFGKAKHDRDGALRASTLKILVEGALNAENFS